MDAKIKADWVAELRSGKWVQAKGSLIGHPEKTGDVVPDNARCCLGVLCEIAADAGIVQRGGGEEDTGFPGFDAVVDGEPGVWTALPPEPVVEWAGLGEYGSNPRTPKGHLAVLNDQGMSFNEIADLIEQYL